MEVQAYVDISPAHRFLTKVYLRIRIAEVGIRGRDKGEEKKRDKGEGGGEGGEGGE